MTTRADLTIELIPPPAARPAAVAVIEGVEESIQGQVMLLATNDTTYDPDLMGWLINQGLLSSQGLAEPAGESVMADDYETHRGLIEDHTEAMRRRNDSVNGSAFAAFDTTNETFQSIVDKAEALNTQMAQAPGPSEGEQYMPLGAEYDVIRSALRTLSDVIDLVDDAHASMETYAGDIERANPGNNGDPARTWGESSPVSDAAYTPTAEGSVAEILRIAQHELERGVAEQGANTAYYTDTGEETPYNIDDAWCAAFTSHVWEQAGYDVDWTNPNYVPSIWNDAKSMGLARQTGQAEPGDLIIFDWQGDGTPDHIGIVESVNGSTITTIEGNSSDRVQRNNYQIGNSDLVGVVKPPPSTAEAAAAS